MSALLNFFRRNPPIDYRVGSGPDPHSGPAIVFVHGVSGSGATTWQPMMRVSAEDHALNGFTLDCYDYPTSLVHWPWLSRFANLRELAQGLKTELETRHSARHDITIVAHSLGGLVARQYIVSEMKAKRKPFVNRLLLFAVPNTGASLAAIGSTLSWNHRHLKSICRGSEVLDILNEDWITLGVEDQVQVRYVIGGADGIVTADSAVPYPGRDNVSTLIGYDHNTLIQPTDTDDIRYAILRRFALNHPKSQLSQVIKIPEHALRRPADPLFDIYDPQDEPYYSARPVDSVLKAIMSGGHIWLSGVSGVGKTTALRHCALTAGWRLQQITLGSYQGRSGLGVFRAIYAELADLQNGSQPNANSDSADLISSLKRTLRGFPDDTTVTILIEEIPLALGQDFNTFIEIILMAMLAIEADTNPPQKFPAKQASSFEATLRNPNRPVWGRMATGAEARNFEAAAKSRLPARPKENRPNPPTDFL